MEALNKNDQETMKQLISEDLVYRVHGRGPQAGTYKGHQGFMQIMEAVKGVINVKPLVILADDEHVFMSGRLTEKRNGKVIDTENCYLYRLRDGKMVEGRNVPTDQYASDEFWS